MVSCRLAPGFKPFQHPAESAEAGEAGRGAGGPIADLHWVEQVVPVFGRMEQQEQQASRTELILPTVFCVVALAFFWVRNSGGIESKSPQQKREEVQSNNNEGVHDRSLNCMRITERKTTEFEKITTFESTNNIFENGTSEDEDIAKEFEEFSRKEEERQLREKLEKEKNEQKEREEIIKIQIEKKDAEEREAERKENERKEEELKLAILLREQNERKIQCEKEKILAEQIESEKIEQRKKEEEKKVMIATAKRRKVSHAQNKDWEEPEWITKTKTFKITKVWKQIIFLCHHQIMSKILFLFSIQRPTMLLS